MTAGIAVVARADEHPQAQAAGEIAAIAVGLGLLADLLFREALLGLNAPLWIGALLGALWHTGRHRVVPASRPEQVCYAVSFLAAAALAWRGSPALQALLFLASGVFLVLGVAIRSGLSWRRAGVAMLLGALIAAGIAIAAGVVRVQSRMPIRNDFMRRSKAGAGTALRIALIGGPVLLVFGLLFASADAVFEEQLRRLTGFDLSAVVPHVFWLLAGTWLGGGILWAAYEGPLLTIPAPQLPEPRRLGLPEVATILGALALLFAAFVAVQLRYLFGGHEVVQASIGLTYAEYARRGFFELVTAGVLLLPLLLIADWARRRSGRADTVYRALAGILVALLFVVMASALQRVAVYEQAYGLTEARLYAVAVLLWLAIVFALFARLLALARNDEFVTGAIAAAMAVLAVLTILGPDAVVARRNMDRVATHPFDAAHAASLGADAVPILVHDLHVLAPADACTVARGLLDRWSGGSRNSLRSWNWSRAVAARTVADASSDLAHACGARS